MGSGLSILNNTSDTWYVKLGPDEAALDVVDIALTALSVVTLGASAVVGAVITAADVSIVTGELGAKLEEAGFAAVDAGGKADFGPMTLSLWQQGTCVRHLIKDGGLYMQTLYMRPIFSGATDGDVNEHDMQWWIDKDGVSEEFICSISDMENEDQPAAAPVDDSSYDIQEMWSPNGAYKFVMQDDGNAVLYHDDTSLWASDTGSMYSGPFRLVMQGDGNLVAYDGNGTAYWASNTDGAGTAPFTFSVQDDGNCVIYDANSVATWATGTNA